MIGPEAVLLIMYHFPHHVVSFDTGGIPLSPASQENVKEYRTLISTT